MKINLSENRIRCGWCGQDPLYISYHDKEWGVPVKRDKKWFEFLLLEGAQAGLSWITILRKREAYRAAFAGFDYNKVARFNEARIQSLLGNPGIVRNQLKIRSAINNARALIRIREEFGSFNRYAWQFVDGEPIKNHWHSLAEIPVTTRESDAMAKDLKQRGFSFVGSTICYAFMQATGLVNDHLRSCFRYDK